MPESREGQRVPEATFRMRRHEQWVEITTGALFGGRTVVLFAVPGAFTPVSSAAHVPRYQELSRLLCASGVDEIVCLAVNDPYVLEAWALDQRADRITFLPDSRGDFSARLGMLAEQPELGPRSRRYSMLVRDGLIAKMFIEPEGPGDPLQLSDAATMLACLNPAAREPQAVLLFTRPRCPHSARARAMLRGRAIPFEEVVVGRMVDSPAVRAVSGTAAVPQVFIDGQHIGGADALAAWLDRQP